MKHEFMCQKDKYGLRKMVQILVFFCQKTKGGSQLLKTMPPSGD